MLNDMMRKLNIVTDFKFDITTDSSFARNNRGTKCKLFVDDSVYDMMELIKSSLELPKYELTNIHPSPKNKVHERLSEIWAKKPS
jgi:hypothetical protein